MMKKCMRVTFSFLMILAVIFFGTFGIVPVNAAEKDPQTLGDLKQILADLKNQKAKNEAQQESTKKQIAAKQKAISDAEKAITQAEADIEKAEEKIQESTIRIEGLKEQTENILKVLQQLQSQNVYLEYLSDASSITELVMRISAIEQIAASNQKNLDALDALIKQNEQLKKELAQKEKELEIKMENLEKAVKDLYGNLESYDKFALDIDTQIKTAQSQVDTYKALCAASSKSYLGDKELLIDCSPTPYNAGWLKPLVKGSVTSLWGSRTDPITGKKSSWHSGIDIGRNAEGTPVYAAAAGTVSGIISRYKCGGNMLYINVTVGGKQYTTYYYHLLKINVKMGQVVTQNTIIGTVGGGSTSTSRGGYDGCTTGAHLHFGVMTGFYSAKTGTPASRQIKPPGFNNQKGYSWTSRTAYYG